MTSMLVEAGILAEDAPAKVNLHLHVTGRRPDGYHLLDSLVVFAGAADRVTAAPGEGLTLTIEGPEAGGLAAEPDNLVLRAARLLAEAAGRDLLRAVRRCRGGGARGGDAARGLVALGRGGTPRISAGGLYAGRAGGHVPAGSGGA